jgi:two-component system, CAI-1 autoinducer sensor kinase/phosphatase CqsS
VSVMVTGDFEFHGSNSLLVYVLFNLLKNSLYALKAAGKGSISIAVASGDARNTLTFSDTGCGIPATTLPKIFDAFFTTKKSAGAGIGLAFCRRVIRSFGGQMRCESIEGEWTRFSMEFPALRPVPAARGEQARAAAL